MKKTYINYFILFLFGTLLLSCTDRDDTFPVSQGEADFSNYVAFGNSLTAGYADNALYDDGQLVSYANLLAERLQQVGGGAFTVPMTHSDIGVGSSGNARLVLEELDGELGPVPATEDGAGDLSIFTESVADEGPFNNMGVPGATALTAVFQGYGNPQNGEGNFNPFFTRMLAPENVGASMLEMAVAQAPTFFTVFIGNNDVLGYATSGGAGEPISPEGQFSAAYDAIIDAFVANGAEGAVANIPDVTSTPFFTTIPYNAIVLSTEEAEGLNTGIEAAVTPYLPALGAILGTPIESYEDLVQTGIIPVFEEGPNGLLIRDDNIPLLGVRLMREGELVPLTAQADLLAFQKDFEDGTFMQMIQGNGDIFEKIGAIQEAALSDKNALTLDEIEKIEKATETFNNKIKTAAESHDLAFVDVNQFFKDVAQNGMLLNGREITTEFVTGGAFSLDGIHLTPIGNVLLANEFIKAINKTYNASIPRVDPSSYGGVQFP